MELNNNHSEHDEKLGKLLRKLPKVDASPDFEAGLQRKLSARPEPNREMGFFSTFLFSQRVPVFVTSIIALLAVSVISYYLFINNNNNKNNVTDQQVVTSQPEQSLASVQKESGSESKTISSPETGIEEQSSISKSLQKVEQTITKSPARLGKLEKHKTSESTLEDASQPNPTRNEPAQDVHSKDNEYAQPSVEMDATAPSTAPSTQQFQSVEPTQDQTPTTKQIQTDQSIPTMQSIQSSQPVQSVQSARAVPSARAIQQTQEESSQIRSSPSIDEVLSKQKENASGVQMNKYLRGGRASESKMEQINPSAVRRSPRYSMSVPIDTSKVDSLRRDSLKNIERQAKKRKP